ncbi:pseudoazurin [uncultured Bartonella sp.]|uniref:pseudoazurin n=1 Tax=uncultured Bartonella sp. TaxID=104108 RepID=UPI002605044C|nr:pseudoazurin [uncultured Bartonella sp.]
MRILFGFVALLVFLSTAQAETYEVKMLNRGAAGSMVFEPDYLVIKPGDRVKFVATQKSHNAATIDDMIPEGAVPFKGKIDEELEITFDKAGFYGIKCIPHYAMGMIMLIKVGDATLPQSYLDHKQPGVAKKRFDDIFSRVDKGE